MSERSWRADVFEELGEALYEFGDMWDDALYGDYGDEDERDEAVSDVVDGFAMELIAYFEYIVLPKIAGRDD